LPIFHLGELGSSFAVLLLFVGLGMVAVSVLDPNRTSHRAVLFTVAIILVLRYGWWRATETVAPFGLTLDWLASWSFLAIEFGAIATSLSAYVILMRVRHRSSEVDRHLGWWQPGPPPRVAVLIATYNEDREVLERTIAGATALHHPNAAVYLLDDGRRDWLAELAERRGLHYLRRDDNKGSKAGNINNALRVLGEGPDRPDFIAVLDADFVPHSDFVSRALALFHEPDVGLVQTPQHFFNADPIQHNLGLSRSYPDEQRFFFDHLEPARDAWGIALCCGTSSMLRMSALDEIGGFPTESVTEDFMVTLCLQDAGWRTVYLDEPLTEGIAPEGLKEYVTQRARWCLGLMQIARSRMGPLARNNLRIRDRWSILDSLFYWMMSFSFRIAALLFPLLYWFFNVTVVDATVPDVVAFFGPTFVWSMICLNFISRGLVVPVVNDVSQLLAAIPITRAAYTGLLKPTGHKFSVTAKGGDRSRIVIQWRMMAPFAVIFALSFIGVLIGILSDRFAYNDAGDGKIVVLFWTFYNLFVLAVTIIVCFELPRRERHFGDRPERTTLTRNGQTSTVWITSLSADAARIRGIMLPKDDHVTVDIDRVGAVSARVASATSDGGRLVLDTTDDQHQALLRRFYAEGAAPGVTSTRISGLVEDIAKRLSFDTRQS
jgi:cellulose synthase (UDP-forming)